MSSSKRILSGVFWSTLGSIISAVYGFFSVPILLLHFGKQEYGLIGLAYSINVYLRLMDMGFSSGNVKFFSSWLAKNELYKLNKLFQSSLVFYGMIGLGNALILFIITLNSAWIFSLNPHQADTLNNMFYVLMITAFFGWISSLLDQFLKANEIIGWEQRLIIISKLLQVLVLYLTIKYNFNVSLFFMLTSFCALVILPFSIYKIKTLTYKVSFFPKYDHNIFKEVLPYSISIFSFSIFQFSAVYLRPLIVSIRSDLSSVTDFRILEGIANVVLLLGTSFVGVILPLASKVITMKDKGRENKIAYEGTKYISVFLAVVVFGFLLISKDLLTIYVGYNYTYLTIWLNLWVLTLLGTHNSALSSLVISGTKFKPIVLMSAISTISSLTLAWYITPIYHVGGVIISYFVYILLQMCFYYLYYYPKIMKLNAGRLLLKSFVLPTLKIAGGALCTYFIVIQLNINNSYLRVMFSGLIYLAISFPVIYILVLNAGDKTFLVNLLKKKN